MSYKQMTGNIISATKVEPNGFYTNNAASGVWNLQDQYDYVRGGNWPTAGNFNPRGIFMAIGNEESNIMEYIQITTTGNSTDFGDLLTAVFSTSNGQTSSSNM